MFATAQNNPETAPLVLWLNGGPGCSSVMGMLYENGPYVFWEDADMELVENPYSLN